jgi:MATE family multidrug resistance protein
VGSPLKSRLVTLLALALPMVLARATQSVITFADALQTEHLGPGALAATATGGLNVLCIAILPMGTVFIVQSFVAQLVGADKREEAPRFAAYGIVLAMLAGLLSLVLVPAIGPVLSLTSYSSGVQTEMTDYMSIRLLSLAAAVGVEALGNWYGGLGNTWMQMIAGIIQMVTAVFFNWLLIDGHLGAPALGVAGAAWGAVIATWLGFGFLALAYWRRWGGAPRGKNPKLTLTEFRRVVRFGLPNGINWFFDFAAFQVFINVVLSSLGDETVAALNAVIAVNSIGFMPAFGLASAGAILAGQAIGAGKRDEVWPQVKMTLSCTMTWMGVIAIFYVVMPGRILALFDSKGTSTALVSIGTTMLLLSAIWQLFDAISMTLAETLRAAGDTFWTAAARIALAWLVFMPAAVLVVMRWDGGPGGAMLCLAGYLALLALALGYRFRTGAWRRIELIETRLL